jgi:hypothetical protein
MSTSIEPFLELWVRNLRWEWLAKIRVWCFEEKHCCLSEELHKRFHKFWQHKIYLRVKFVGSNVSPPLNVLFEEHWCWYYNQFDWLTLKERNNRNIPRWDCPTCLESPVLLSKPRIQRLVHVWLRLQVQPANLNSRASDSLLPIWVLRWDKHCLTV